MSVNKVNSDGSLLRVAGGTLYADSPIGTIVPFGGSVIPKGYLLCDGTEVLKTTYAELYAVIGDAFGTASVNTKFVLPDLRESVPKGAGLTGKTVGNHLDADGLAVGEFLDDRVQTHEHYIGDSATPQHLGYSDSAGQNAGIGNRTVDATIESDRKWIALGQTNVGIARSGRYGSTTEVKSVGVNYIIKAKMVAVPADFMSAVDDAVEEALEGVTLLESELTDTQVTVSLSESVANYQYITIEIYGPGIIRGSTFTKAVAGREYLIPFTYSGELVIGEIQIQNVGTTAKVKYSFSGGSTVSNVSIRVIGIAKKS